MAASFSAVRQPGIGPAGKSTVPRLLAISVPLNFAWEMLQMPAFAGLPESWLAASAVCALAAIGDAVIVVAIYACAAYFFRDPRWFVPLSARRYAVIVTTGLLLHLLIEWVAVHRLARWSYRDVHPIVPGLDVGVLPILQPTILLPLTFWFLGKAMYRWGS